MKTCKLHVHIFTFRPTYITNRTFWNTQNTSSHSHTTTLTLTTIGIIQIMYVSNILNFFFQEPINLMTLPMPSIHSTQIVIQEAFFKRPTTISNTPTIAFHQIHESSPIRQLTFRLHQEIIFYPSRYSHHTKSYSLHVISTSLHIPQLLPSIFINQSTQTTIITQSILLIS